jgi:hypothetical protein
MGDRAFFLLYLLCLGLCVAAVQGARAARASLPDPVERELERWVAVAIPPKPETELDRGTPGAEGEGTRYDEAACDRYEGDFRDVCYHALARQRAARDLDGALLACEVVERRRLRNECLADAAELHVGTDLGAARGVCPGIPARKWRDQCYFGIAMALVGRDPQRALLGCEDAGIWRDFCRHDVLGEVSVSDLDFVLEACGREQGDLLTRKTCWHGIGKYIGRVDLPRAFEACERVPMGPSNLYRENCIHGAGWAAGERFADAGLSHCGRAGALEDSCRLGVAFQIERSQPQRAVEICRSVARVDLREHCLDWVSR